MIVLTAPGLSFASRTGEVVLDTISGLAIGFAAVVALSRWRPRSRALDRLAAVLTFNATAMLFVSVSPALLGFSTGSGLWTARQACTLMGAALLVWVSFAVPTQLGVVGSRWRFVAAASVAAGIIAGVGAAVATIGPRLAVDYRVPGLWGASGYVIHQPLSVMLIEGASVLLLGLAAARFARRSPQAPIPFPMWLMLSALLGAWSQTDYLLNSGSSTLSVSLGDLLAAASSLSMAGWAICELGRLREDGRRLAAEHERERLAQEFHDNVAQELVYIVRQSRRLQGAFPAASGLAHIGTAAQHALDDSRLRIHDLREPGLRDLGRAVETRARELVTRAGLELRLDVDQHVRVSAAAEHEVLSILGEAVANTAKHAQASRLGVSVGRRGDVAVVRVSDDGRGFDRAARVRAGSVGLWSMRERAVGLGGDLVVQSHPGAGTTVEVTFRLTPA